MIAPRAAEAWRSWSAAARARRQIGAFVRDCLVPSTGEELSTRSTYQAYAAWCSRRAIVPFSEKRFSSEIARTGLEKRNGRVRTFLNVRLAKAFAPVG